MDEQRYSNSIPGSTRVDRDQETAVATLDLRGAGDGSGLVALHGSVDLTPASDAGSLVVRLRHGAIAGEIIAEDTLYDLRAAVSDRDTFDLEADATLSEDRTGRVYLLTVQQSGAGGHGDVHRAKLEGAVTPA